MWYAESLRQLDRLGDERRLRLLDSRTGTPGPLRVTLFLGAARVGPDAFRELHEIFGQSIGP